MITNKKILTAKAAEKIMNAAMKKAEENGWQVSIAIVDDAGRLLYFVRMDNTPNASVEVAISKQFIPPIITAIQGFTTSYWRKAIQSWPRYPAACRWQADCG